MTAQETAHGANDTDSSHNVVFEAPVETIGDRELVRLPGEASARLPSRGQVAARVRLNGSAVAAVVEPDGRRGHWLAIDTGHGLEAGDVVNVEIEPTKDWPEPEIPDDLGSALGEATDIAGVWADITPMARWEWVRWVNATRNPQTRERRVEVSISKLRSGKRRPCCFDLSSCTDPELSTSGKLVDPDQT
ncbi:DUF1905 domain-containing protein [Occultella glacieicola]|uniref:DUF1905 domain-containing protein n=1 Tax=Occultella glacieicola TaxID=2518684 RepID=A0ABY2DZL9_9MICO|nr:YdeI/OmpD-associated family protein [Occultella glacieicola]TDE90035.1 DUF1905 domain-containing protein [Occultella glacieicola]